MKIASSEGIHDCATVLALHGDYASLEPYIAAVHGLRVQKIGPHYRVYKKVRHCSGIAAWAPHALNDVARARCT